MSRNRMWTLTEMRVALARHDIRTVFRIMQRFGYPQREIAALTGIAQSEVSEIITARRRIQSYVVLERLIEGLHLPRGWAGLAFDDESATLRELGAMTGVKSSGPPSQTRRRSRLTYRKECARSRLRAGRLTLS